MRHMPMKGLGVLVVVIVLLGVGIQSRWGLSGPFLADRYFAVDTGGLDDGYIAFRYAWNASQGHGLVYNVGEAPVEGYTSLGFVALLIPFARLGKDGLYAGSVLLNTLGLLASVWLGGELGVSLVGGWARRPMWVLMALFPCLWIWANNGLETSFMMACQLACIWGVVRWRHGESGRVALLATMVCLVMRADGFVLPGILCAWLALSDWRKARRMVVVMVGMMVVIVAWRLAYYGYPLPNTYYAKVDGAWTYRIRNAGVGVLVYLLLGGLPGMVLLAGSVLDGLREIVLERRWTGRQVPVEAWVVAFWCGYYVFVGGDFLFERWLLFLFPLGMCVALRMGGETARWRMAALLLFFQFLPVAYDSRLRFYDDKRNMFVAVGETLRVASAGRDDLLALEAAGMVPFWSGLRTLDMLGLNDIYIARLPARGGRPGHQKFDEAYVLAQHPHWVAMFQWEDGRFEPASQYFIDNGYRARFLAWNAEGFPASNLPVVIDVKGWNALDVQRQMADGYSYVVFERDQ